ncbi:MAG TPA: (Fe-S)-binding protein, partial [Nitrospirota bacterium]|nr:(Fe-S)-binding protein [Nitrospirota bacterium]
MKTAVEIYKLLPKTNCGKCATSSCFGFAAKLATRQAKADDCPNMTDSAREELRGADQEHVDSPGTVFEQTLLALKPKFAALDFVRVSERSGATLLETGCLEIAFLNERYTITRDCILDSA